MNKLAVLITASLLSAPVLAEKVAISGGKIFTLAEQGTLESGTVLMTDGTIDRVITGTDVPDGYRVVDASGKVVTPGLVGSMTSLGLVEVSSSAGVVDSSVESTPITRTGAALDVSYAVNPDSSLLGVTRIEGMTAAGTSVTYTDHLFYGQGAVITLSGDAPVLKPRAFMVVNVGEQGADGTGGTRAALWVTLENALAEAAAASADLAPTQDWDGLNTRADVKALKAVLSGEMPLIMEADRAADIRQVIAFKKRHSNIDVVLMHGVEAWRVAPELAEADIPVILDPEYNLPGGFDQMGATLANAARLEAAGVTVAVGMDTHNIRLATQHAGNAVANGLSYEGGLASLTRAPAAILGVDDQLGSLQAGKRADVVIWSGDPLEVTQVAEQVFINGQAIEMRSRQTRLRDRYLAVQDEQASRPTHYVRPE